MKQYISSIAGIVSIGAFFLIAIVGAVHGLEPVTCGYRAVCGAVFVYCVMTVVLRIAARIIITAMIESKIKEEQDVEDAG